MAEPFGDAAIKPRTGMEVNGGRFEIMEEIIDFYAGGGFAPGRTALRVDLKKHGPCRGARATGPSCRATSPAERRGGHGGKRSPHAKRAPHPFRPAGRRTVRASGPCHPGLQTRETMSDWSRTERNRSPAIGETAPQSACSAGKRSRSATPATPADPAGRNFLLKWRGVVFIGAKHETIRHRHCHWTR